MQEPINKKLKDIANDIFEAIKYKKKAGLVKKRARLMLVISVLIAGITQCKVFPFSENSHWDWLLFKEFVNNISVGCISASILLLFIKSKVEAKNNKSKIEDRHIYLSSAIYAIIDFGLRGFNRCEINLGKDSVNWNEGLFKTIKKSEIPFLQKSKNKKALNRHLIFLDYKSSNSLFFEDMTSDIKSNIDYFFIDQYNKNSFSADRLYICLKTLNLKMLKSSKIITLNEYNNLYKLLYSTEKYKEALDSTIDDESIFEILSRYEEMIDILIELEYMTREYKQGFYSV